MLVWVTLTTPALGQSEVLRVTVLRASDQQLELRWDPVPRALGYEVLSLRNGRWWLNEDEPSYTPATSSTTLSGLRPDQEYQFRIRAVLRQSNPLLGPIVVVRTLASGSPVAEAPLREARPLPESLLGSEPNEPQPSPSAAPRSEPAQEPIENLNAPIADLLPPPPRTTPSGTPRGPARSTAPEKPKGPPPAAPSTVMGLYVKQEEIRLSWRRVEEATGYLVEEQSEGEWKVVEGGVIEENRPSLTVSSHPAPGPYYFRVLAVRGGVRSAPSFVVKVER